MKQRSSRRRTAASHLGDRVEGEVINTRNSAGEATCACVKVLLSFVHSSLVGYDLFSHTNINILQWRISEWNSWATECDGRQTEPGRSEDNWKQSWWLRRPSGPAEGSEHLRAEKIGFTGVFYPYSSPEYVFVRRARLLHSPSIPFCLLVFTAEEEIWTFVILWFGH